MINSMQFSLILVLVVVADQLTKNWIVSSFRLYESREIFQGLLNITYVTNTGAAFSLFADVDSPWRHYFFVTIAVVALIGITTAYIFMRRDHRLYGVALSLIAGGALGNLIDRVRLGAVVDFIDVMIGSYHWPAFNVADSAICVGVGLFLLINILEERKKKKI